MGIERRHFWDDVRIKIVIRLTKKELAFLIIRESLPEPRSH
jgi:hypothetical protein